MDERLRAFSAFVMAHPGSTVDELAEYFRVSSRTVREYRKRANYALEGAGRLDLDRGRMRMEVVDGRALRSLISGSEPDPELDVEAVAGLPLELSSEAWSVAGAMVDAVESAFSLEFGDDLELRMNLARHVEPLGARLKAGEVAENPLLGDVKSRYPLAFSMAARTADVLERAYGAKPSEDELGYIALAFALALERGRERAPRKNIVVVCATGHTSARLLEHRIRSEFGPQLGRVELCDKDDLLFRDLSHTDYVFTTVPIEATLPVPTVTISYFFGEDEAAAVRDLLTGRPRESVADFFPAELFCPRLDCATKAEAIHALCSVAADRGFAGEGFEEAVWDREEVASTAFGSLVAIPHPLGRSCERTFVAVGLLEAPVLWDESGAQAQAVFLVGFGAGDGDRFEGLFGRLAHYFTEPGSVARLLSERDHDALVAAMDEASPTP